MESIEIIISPFVNQCLEEINDYYLNIGSEEVAKKVLTSIFDEIEQLRTNLSLGSNEHSLPPKKFILVYNFKIIFERKGHLIEILDIFHTAQNPEKISKRIK